MQSAFKGADTAATKALSELGSLSERQLLFVTAFLQGASKAEAALAAGYSHESGMSAWRSKKVQAAIGMLLGRFLLEDAAPASIRALYMLVTDDKQPGSIRVTAANSLLDRAGFSAKRHEKPDQAGRDPSTMSPSELQAEIDKLQRAIDDKMRDITPIDTPTDSQDIEIFR